MHFIKIQTYSMDLFHKNDAFVYHYSIFEIITLLHQIWLGLLIFYTLHT